MKILIVTDCNLGNRRSGGTNRILGLAKALSKYVTIIVIHSGPNKVEGHIKFIGYKSGASAFFLNTFHWIHEALNPYVNSICPDLYRALKKFISDVDIVQIEGSYSFIPTTLIAKAVDRKTVVVLDEHNVDFLALKSKINGVSTGSMATLPYLRNFSLFHLSCRLTPKQQLSPTCLLGNLIPNYFQSFFELLFLHYRQELSKKQSEKFLLFLAFFQKIVLK
jgi:hypothetical protein